MINLKCPDCDFEGEICDFPDLFYTDCESTEEIINQEKLLFEIQNKGYNIINCGMCGSVFIHRL